MEHNEVPQHSTGMASELSKPGRSSPHTSPEPLPRLPPPVGSNVEHHSALHCSDARGSLMKAQEYHCCPVGMGSPLLQCQRRPYGELEPPHPGVIGTHPPWVSSDQVTSLPLALPEQCQKKPTKTGGLNKMRSLITYTKTPRFQSKITCHSKNQKELKPHGRRQSMDVNTKMTAMVELPCSDFKTEILSKEIGHLSKKMDNVSNRQRF